MNGLREGFYYTVHVTPEPGFNYSSFETNDPAYRSPQARFCLLRRMLVGFCPCPDIMLRVQLCVSQQCVTFCRC